MKTLLIAALMILTASWGQAQQGFSTTTPTASQTIEWKASIASLALAGALQADSSIRAHAHDFALDPSYNLNQVRNQAVTFGAIAGVEILVAHKWPSSVKVMRWVNFAFSGVQIGRSISNYHATPTFVFSPLVGRPDCRTQVCR